MLTQVDPQVALEIAMNVKSKDYDDVSDRQEFLAKYNLANTALRAEVRRGARAARVSVARVRGRARSRPTPVTALRCAATSSRCPSSRCSSAR